VPGSDVTAHYETSVATGRTMDEIAEGKSKVWRSNRALSKAPARAEPSTKRAPAPQSAYERLMARRTR
jgi:hypothetical protein